MGNPTIFCIVVTYNASKWIEKCFGSLCSSAVPLQIIAIDNASTDNTVILIKQKFPSIDVIEAGKNLGFGQANNIGLRKAVKQNADYVFLLNQDAWIKEHTIKKLVEASKINPEFGIISPFHLDTTEKKFETLFSELFYRYNNTILEDMYFNRLQCLYETEYIHAACWLMSRQCVETTGGFDPLYLHYGEDDDYLQRAKYFNFKIGLVPAASIVHDSVYNGWNELEWNENRNMVIAFQQLKKMSPHFRSNVLLFCKMSLDELASLLLFRKFKKLRFRWRIFSKAFLAIRKIHKSYQHSFVKGAFLNHE